MLPMPPRYRLKFTGQEIDVLLRRAVDLLGQSEISNDWNGGKTKMASAELAKILRESVNQFLDPIELRKLIETIPGINFLTTEMVDKLNRMSEKFRGVFRTTFERDTTLKNEIPGYKGDEIVLVVDDHDGLSRWYYWDLSNTKWIPIDFYNFGLYNEGVITDDPANPGSTLPLGILEIDPEKYLYVKILIYGVSGNKIESRHVTIAFDNRRWSYWNVYNHCGSTTKELGIDVIELPGGKIRVNVDYDSGATIKSSIMSFIEREDYNTIFEFDGMHIKCAENTIYLNIADGGFVGDVKEIVFNFDGGDFTIPADRYDHVAEAGSGWLTHWNLYGGDVGTWNDTMWNRFADGNRTPFDAYSWNGGNFDLPDDAYFNVWDGGLVKYKVDVFNGGRLYQWLLEQYNHVADGGKV